MARPAWSAALRPLLEDELEPEDAVPELLEPLELLELHAASDRVATTASSTPVRRKVRERSSSRLVNGGHPSSSGILVIMSIMVIMVMECDSYHNHHLWANGQDCENS